MAPEELNPYQSSIEPPILAEIVPEHWAMTELKVWFKALGYVVLATITAGLIGAATMYLSGNY